MPKWLIVIDNPGKWHNLRKAQQIKHILIVFSLSILSRAMCLSVCISLTTCVSAFVWRLWHFSVRDTFIQAHGQTDWPVVSVMTGSLWEG